jgi:hypothetical protein
MNETDTATRVLEILDELNDRGARAWDEFVYTLPEYDRVKTGMVYQGVGGAFVALGTVFRYDVEDAAWISQDFGGNETYIP